MGRSERAKSVVKKDKLRYSIIYEVDKELLCDEETLNEEFDGSWQKFMDWFAKEELGEVIMGFSDNPTDIIVNVEDNPNER